MFYFFLYYSPNSPRAKQARNLAIAAEHIPVVRKVLDKDERFADIRAFAYTGKDGCLGIIGSVYGHNAMDDLEKAVQATAPPIHVHWEVKVYHLNEKP